MATAEDSTKTIDGVIGVTVDPKPATTSTATTATSIVTETVTDATNHLATTMSEVGLGTTTPKTPTTPTLAQATQLFDSMITSVEPAPSEMVPTELERPQKQPTPLCAPAFEPLEATNKILESLTDTSIEPKKLVHDIKDNGIFEFMTPERAIELYQRIQANNGMPPDLEWKFYGRRDLNEPQENNDGANNDQCDNGTDTKEDQDLNDNQDSALNTEFDFDESFSEMSVDTSTFINDSLQLKKRPEPGSEKKTNLSDIMSDIWKETNHNEIE